MTAEMRAIEVTGTVDEAGRLRLDEPLRAVAPGRVRLLVLTATENKTRSGDEDEHAWLAAAATSPSLAFLNDAAEDVYSPDDGRPFADELSRTDRTDGHDQR